MGSFWARTSLSLENTSKYGFFPDFGGGGNGSVLSMRMQVILDSSFARPGSAPIWGGKKGEFRDWTIWFYVFFSFAEGPTVKNRDELNHAPKAGLSSILRKTNPYQLTNF